MSRPPDPQRTGRCCCVVADDLTGSCDATVHFARRGLTVAVAISGDGRTLSREQVVAINTDSRCTDEEAAAERVHAAIQAIDDGVCALFKKVDSSLRGHVAAEIRAAMQASGCELAFFAPSLPALGRTVIRGRVRLPSGEEIDVARVLSPLVVRVVSVEELASLDRAMATVQDAREQGTGIFCFDAESDAHLDQIVALGGAFGLRILWVGSAGLAAALARAIAPDPVRRGEELCEVDGPVLFCVGSDHEATLAQVTMLRENGGALECSIDTQRIDDVREAALAGRNVVLRLPPCGIGEARIAEFARVASLNRFGGVVLTGGDTASRFLRAIGAHTLEVRAEVMPGIPVSLVRGGVADGMRVITKSGAFGAADAFLRCVDFLQGSGRDVEEGTRQ